MELLAALLTFGGSALLALIGGVLIGRGDAPRTVERKTSEEESAHHKEITALKAELSALKAKLAATVEPPPDSPFQEDTEVVNPGLAEQLEAEVELLRTELVNKEREIQRHVENTNRLGSRILEVENELHQKEDEVARTVEKREALLKSELIKDGMDTFVDALQKESDVLRTELEDAYRVINRQERELSRLRGTADSETSAHNDLQSTIDLLTEELQELRGQVRDYETALKESRVCSSTSLKLDLGKKSPLPVSKEALKASALRTEKARSNRKLQEQGEPGSGQRRAGQKAAVPPPLSPRKAKRKPLVKGKTLVPPGGVPKSKG